MFAKLLMHLRKQDALCQSHINFICTSFCLQAAQAACILLRCTLPGNVARYLLVAIHLHIALGLQVHGSPLTVSCGWHHWLLEPLQVAPPVHFDLALPTHHCREEPMPSLMLLSFPNRFICRRLNDLLQTCQQTLALTFICCKYISRCLR